MTKRGAVIVGVMLGLFVLSFGALGVRALTLGPAAPRPSAAEIATRQQAANSLEHSIRVARADVPPSLPAVPDRVVVLPASVASVPASSAGRTAVAMDDRGDDEADEEAYEAEHQGDDEKGEFEESDRSDD